MSIADSAVRDALQESLRGLIRSNGGKSKISDIDLMMLAGEHGLSREEIRSELQKL